MILAHIMIHGHIILQVNFPQDSLMFLLSTKPEINGFNFLPQQEIDAVLCLQEYCRRWDIHERVFFQLAHIRTVGTQFSLNQF